MIRNNNMKIFIDDIDELQGKVIENVNLLENLEEGTLYQVITFENDEIAIFDNELELISQKQFEKEKNFFNPVDLFKLSLMTEQESEEINVWESVSSVDIDELDKKEKEILISYFQRHLKNEKSSIIV